MAVVVGFDTIVIVPCIHHYLHGEPNNRSNIRQVIYVWAFSDTIVTMIGSTIIPAARDLEGRTHTRVESYEFPSGVGCGFKFIKDSVSCQKLLALKALDFRYLRGRSQADS